MESESFSVLLVTANVGSVFEDPSRLLKSWIKEFLTKIVLSKPDFLALHLQEVGGKTYDKSMEYVQEFIKNLCEAEELADYNRIRIFLDEDYNSAEHFTALGNLYFAHKSINTVKIWNFLTHDWEMADEKTIHTGNIEAVATKEKAKFPQHFFPECKWSRKGFLRTRWELNGTILDFVNIHLFHDASNLAACEEFPSVYCKTRRRALVHTLERFHKDTRNGLAPYFVFGDFNFRCDTEGVIKKLTEDLTAHRVQSAKSDNTKVQYRNSDGHNVLTVGKKEFSHADHQTKFKESWLQQFDRELEPLREVLVEYPITFPPSYPYEEDPDMPNNYMSTRCPAWCDRILMSPSARELILDEVFSSSDYNVVGDEICMGDHKPVFLSVHVKTLQGILRSSCCCEHDNHPSYLIDLERTNKKLSASFANNCLYSSNEFYKILLECRKLDNSVVAKKSKFIHNNTNDNDNNSEKIPRRNSIELNSNQTYSENLQPLISINVTDAENANVCMCSQYSNRKRSMSLVYIDEDSTNYNNADTNDNDVDTDGSICPECRNIIKRQPTEHRCTLISKRLQLANNIIVNRIDMHYLTTYTDTRQEPYTPESAESHSPYPELSEEFNSQNDLSLVNNKTNCSMQLFNSSDSHVASVKTPNQSSSAKDGILSPSNLRGVVSPRQLKTRLENLQRASLNSDLDESDEKIIFKSKKNFKKRCCTIL